MPTIDELVLKITIDSAGTKAGVEEVKDQLAKTRDDAEKTGRETDRSGSKAAEFYLRIGKAAEQAKPKVEDFGKVLAGLGVGVAGTVAAVIAALKGFDTIADNITRPLMERWMVKGQTGMSVADQSMWDEFAKRFDAKGGDTNASSAYTGMFKDMEQFLAFGGDTSNYKGYFALGTSPFKTDDNGHVVPKTATELFMSIHDAVVKLQATGKDAQGNSLGSHPRDWPAKIENMVESLGVGTPMALGLTSPDFGAKLREQLHIAPNSNEELNAESIKFQQTRDTTKELIGQTWNDLMAPWIREETKLLAALNSWLDHWRATPARENDPSAPEYNEIHKAPFEGIFDYLFKAPEIPVSIYSVAQKKSLQKAQQDFFNEERRIGAELESTHERLNRFGIGITVGEYNKQWAAAQAMGRAADEAAKAKFQSAIKSIGNPKEFKSGASNDDKQTNITTGDIIIQNSSGDPKKAAGAFHRELQSLVRYADTGQRA
jgi:hypothetical protein